MSNYNDLTKKIYADMSLRGVTLRHIQDLFDLSIIEIRTNRSFDHDAVFRVTADVKSALKQILAQGRDDKIQELYDHCLLLEAPYLLDSYCLYIEKNRPADERFYEPRRKTLIKVVNALQRLENDEMDEQFIHMPARVGKLLADDTPVFTADGWKTHGELKVGDRVIGSDGKYTEVIHVHEPHHTTHTVVLQDGTKIDCHANHEWTVYDRRCAKWKTLETRQMIGHLKNKCGNRNVFLVPQKPVMCGTHRDFKLDPYVLGVWIGDGTNTKPCVTGDKNDRAIIDEIEHCGIPVRNTYVHKTTGVYTYDFGRPLYEKLREYDMCFFFHTKEKHIPTEYLTADIDQRLRLLAGLIDTDGCLIKQERRYQFTSADKRVIDDVVTLVHSLGWRTCVTEIQPRTSSSGIVGKRVYWTVCFNPLFEIPCVLERKQLKEFSIPHRVGIESIYESAPKIGRCITVSNSDGLYAVGKTMTLTHNSMMLTEALAWHACRNTELSNLYVTYTESVASAFLDGIKEIMLDPTYLHRDVFPDAAIVDTDAVAHTLDLGRKKKYKSISTKGLEASLNGAYDARGWVLVDDVIKGVEEVMNPEVLHRKQLLFDNNLMRRRKTGSKVIYNGTIWSLHDMYMDRMRFLQESPEAKHIRWDVLKIPALDPITDESNFDYDYGVGFSTQYYRTERAKFEANEDMAGWYAQFQQEPIERDGALFVPGHLNYYNGVLPEEEPLKIVAACDVALGGSDFLSMPVAYVYEDGSVYVHDVVFDNSEKNITQPEVVEAIVRNNISSAFFEANQGGEGYKQDIGRRLAERTDFNNGRGIQLVSKYTPGTKRKEQRIWDNAPAIREMFFLEPDKRNSQYSKFMTNLFSFTINGVSKHKHDDAADSMAMLAQFIQKGSGVRSAKIIHGFI